MYVRTGKTDGWREEFERRAPSYTKQWRDVHARELLTAEGDIEGLVAYIERTPPEDTPQLDDRDLELGVGSWAIGEPERARPYLASVAAAVPHSSDDAWRLANGAVALELLGRHAEALAAADRAAELMRDVRDAVNGPQIAMVRAWVLIHSELRAEEGYAELARWLGSYASQPRWVAVQPLWRILRDDARTQPIIRDRFPKA